MLGRPGDKVVKRREFQRILGESGFRVETTEHKETRWIRGSEPDVQAVALDSVRGSAWRVLMARGAVPAIWPVATSAGRDGAWLDAESPWFDYFTDLDPEDPDDARFDSKEQALAKCVAWLSKVGLEWLANPEARSSIEWRQLHGIVPRAR